MSKSSDFLDPEFAKINKAAGAQSGTNYKEDSYMVKHYAPMCSHRGDKVVYDNNGKKLYGASSTGLDEYSGKWGLIIDLAYNVRTVEPFVKQKSSKKFRKLEHYVWPARSIKADVLALDWSDGQSPPVSLDFWLELWPMMPEHTVVACVGSHGRTGTCLGALIIASGVDYYTAVDLVRTEHCDKAIETVVQEKYLHTLYMENLERLIEAEKQPKELADLKEDLKYAKAHVPTQSSSYGLSKYEPNTTGNELVGAIGNGKQNPVDDYMKVVGNRTLFKVCTHPSCKNFNCENPDHLTWVDYDDMYYT